MPDRKTIGTALVIGIGVVAAGSAFGLAGLGGTTATATEQGATIAAPGEASQTFSVERMTCASCPVAVRLAMSRVEGVKSVDVDYASRTATVIFDPSVTSATAIAAASADAGYPAVPKG